MMQQQADFEDDWLDLDAIAITSASEATDAITELTNAITRVDDRKSNSRCGY